MGRTYVNKNGETCIDNREASKEWHLDKKFSIGIIAAICMQCACFVWYGAKLDSRVQQNSTEILDIKSWKDKQDDVRMRIESHLSGMDQKLTDVDETLKDIKESLVHRNR